MYDGTRSEVPRLLLREELRETEPALYPFPKSDFFIGVLMYCFWQRSFLRIGVPFDPQFLGAVKLQIALFTSGGLKFSRELQQQFNATQGSSYSLAEVQKNVSSSSIYTRYKVVQCKGILAHLVKL